MKRLIAQIMIVVGLMTAPLMLSPVPVYAASCPTGGSAKSEVLRGIGQTGNNCSDAGVMSTVSSVVRILGFIAGIAAVIMIISAGFKYITSNGDSGKIGSAKNTLIYALVGLVVAALAQVLVSFVLNSTGKV